MLKNSVPSPTPSITGKVASTIGAAPRRPAQPIVTRSATEKRAPIVATNAATGRATNMSTTARSAAFGAISTRRPGKTRSPSIRNIPSCASHARPSWKVVIVLSAGLGRPPMIRPAT